MIEVVLEPLLGCMLLTLGTVPVATGMIDAVLAFTGWALIEAVAVMTTAAVWDGAEDLAVRQGQVGVRSRYAGAKTVKMSRRVVMAGDRA